jgi:V/A-type H+-transporting ATPase subunit I
VIVQMKKITFMVLEADRERFLQRLQEMGAAHLILPRESVEPGDLGRELGRVTEVRKILERRGTRGRPEKKLHYQEICWAREELGPREAALHSEIAALKKERVVAKPWGDFSLQDVKQLGGKGLHIQFFRISRRMFGTLPLQDVFHQVVAGKGGDICFVTFSPEPVDLGIPAERLPAQTLTEIDREIAYYQAKLQEIDKEYAALAEHLEALEKAEAELTDLLEYQRALLNASSELDNRITVVQCWTPMTEDVLVTNIGNAFTFYHYSEDAGEEDRMPVLLRNPPAFDSGEDLVNVYSYPSHKDFDPSPFVLWCFAIFFGMIVGDLGYGLILLGMTFWLRRKFPSRSPFAIRFFRLMYILSGFVILFGILGGGFFGINLEPDNLLKRISVLEFGTPEGQRDVMILSVLIGMIHICLSMFIKFYMTRNLSWLGWVIAIWGAFFYLKSRMALGVDNPAPRIALIVGLAVVFLFSSESRNLLVRVAEGLLGLLGIVQVFSDVLSYLRLFALGVATVYIAQTFNILGGTVADGPPVVGLVFAGIVLLIGHTLNIALAIMGGVIHGLRLNFLEWYRWCFEGDGLAYKPFQRISER